MFWSCLIRSGAWIAEGRVRRYLFRVSPRAWLALIVCCQRAPFFFQFWTFLASLFMKLLFFGANSGQFGSVLVHLPFPLYNPFQDTFVSKANPLKAKRSTFAPVAPITLNSTGVMGDDLTLRSCSSFQGHVQWIPAYRFAESLGLRCCAHTAVPKSLEISNYHSFFNTHGRWLLIAPNEI